MKKTLNHLFLLVHTSVMIKRKSSASKNVDPLPTQKEEGSLFDKLTLFEEGEHCKIGWNQ